jgi:hypothetical protein
MMVRKKTKAMVSGVALLIVLIFMAGNYAGYLSRVDAMETNGVWTVDFKGSIYMSGGVIYGVIDTFKGIYDGTPDIPDYSDYFFSMFEREKNTIQDIPYNNTLVEVRLTVICVEHNLKARTLFSEKIDVAYLWAGGGFDSNGLIYAFNYTLGQYVADPARSPIKLLACLEIEGTAEVTKTFYLPIPDLEAVQ